MYPRQLWPPEGWRLARGRGPAEADYLTHQDRAAMVRDQKRQDRAERRKQRHLRAVQDV